MPLVRKPCTIVNPNGFHARPAARFVNLANEFAAQVEIEKDGFATNGKSILGLLAMEAYQGDEMFVVADGDDAEAAVTALVALVERGFGEDGA